MNYVHSLLGKCVYVTLLCATQKHVGSVVALGDLQDLLQPAPCARESGLRHHSVAGGTVCRCCWAMSVNIVFVGGQLGRGHGICKKKKKLWLIYYSVVMGLTVNSSRTP